MYEIRYSIYGRTREAYTDVYSTDDGVNDIIESVISINLNTILQVHSDMINYSMNTYEASDSYIDMFLCYVSAVELHEIGHAVNNIDGCNNHEDVCPWCEETYKIYDHLVGE